MPQNLSRTNAAWAVLTAILLAALVFLVRPGSSDAQVIPGSTSLAAGPGGMWVLQGDQLFICREPLIRSAARATEPPTPQCGQPARLP